MLYKHRIIESFLVNILNFSIEDVHEEACHLEHAASDRLVEAMNNMLGFPNRDPHGHPIPDKEGHISDTCFLSLADILPGTKVIINQVSDWDRDKLLYLKENGIIPEVEVLILEAAPFDGSMTLKIDRQTIVISRPMARKIYVDTLE